MHAFTDNAGRQWLVEINVDAVERVRHASDVDLLSAVDPQAHLLERLGADPVLLVGVLWTLLETQAREKAVEAQDFGRAMGGDALDAAAEAFTEALIDFFPRLHRRLLAAAVEKIRGNRESVAAATLEFLAGPEFEQYLKTRLAELKDSFGDVLESSASTPGRGPSASSSSPPTPGNGPSSTEAPG